MQMELVVQNVEERSIKARLHPMGQAVHLDLDATRHTSLQSIGNRERGSARRVVAANLQTVTVAAYEGSL
jgi:hypothetical protein